MSVSGFPRGFFAAAVFAAACGGTPRPVAVTPSDTCAFCRMTVSDSHFAAQLVGSGEEPKFFDDIGCLAGALRRDPPRPGVVAYVADHRTGEWVPMRTAVYSRVPSLTTPMGSHLIAHADEASRQADPVSAGGAVVRFSEVFESGGQTVGSRGGQTRVRPGSAQGQTPGSAEWLLRG